MKRILARVLMAWGAICLVAVLAAFVMVAREMGSSVEPSAEVATVDEVRFVLNWCGLGDERIESVVHSYRSARSFSGDRVDAHAIRVSRLDRSELEAGESDVEWYRADLAPPVVQEAVDVATSLGEVLPWFPSREQLREGSIWVHAWSIELHGGHPTSFDLIFARPADRTIFYLGAKT